MLRKTFGSKRDEITGEWRNIHNAELHALYSSPNIIRNLKSIWLRWAGHVARMELSRNAYKILVGKPEWKRLLGRLSCRWENNIKMDLREVGFNAGDWRDLAQDRVQWQAYVRMVMNLQFLKSQLVGSYKARSWKDGPRVVMWYLALILLSCASFICICLPYLTSCSIFAFI